MTSTDHLRPARPGLILAVLGIAQLMVVLDVTIVNIALPSAQRDLGFSDDLRQWVVTAYALAFGSLLLLGGRLGDLFGRKWTFVAGLLGFAAASAVGGAAGSFGVLVAARAAQGVFGALLAPSALALLSTTFTEPAERGKAFGIFGAIAGSGAAVGLLLGGALTEWLTWRWCLYVNLLFAVPTAVAATRLFAGHVHRDRRRLDLLGTATATAGLFWLVYGLAHSETHSWGDPVTLIMLGASAVLLAAFAAIEARVPHPLLPIAVLRDRTRAGAYLALGLTYVALFAVFLFLTYFLQRTRGFSPIETGLAFLPLAVTVMSTAVVSSAVLVRRVGPRRLLVAGMLLAAAAMAWLARLTPESDRDHMPAWLLARIDFDGPWCWKRMGVETMHRVHERLSAFEGMTFKEIDGFAGFISLVDEENRRARSIVLWETKEGADEAERKFAPIREETVRGMGGTVRSADLFEAAIVEVLAGVHA